MVGTSVGLLSTTTVWWTPTCGYTHMRTNGRPITYECPDGTEHDEGGA